jgi:hypothetical protein
MKNLQAAIDLARFWLEEIADALEPIPTRLLLFVSFALLVVAFGADLSLWLRVPLGLIAAPSLGHAGVRYARERRAKR